MTVRTLFFQRQSPNKMNLTRFISNHLIFEKLNFINKLILLRYLITN
jgi:hypothetical protein